MYVHTWRYNLSSNPLHNCTSTPTSIAMWHCATNWQVFFAVLGAMHMIALIYYRLPRESVFVSHLLLFQFKTKISLLYNPKQWSAHSWNAKFTAPLQTPKSCRTFPAGLVFMPPTARITVAITLPHDEWCTKASLEYASCSSSVWSCHAAYISHPVNRFIVLGCFHDLAVFKLRVRSLGIICLTDCLVTPMNTDGRMLHALLCTVQC